MKALFLVNARSGVRRKYDIRDLIRESCAGWKTGFEIAATERKEDLDRVIDDAERDGFELVYAVGGDGTVHEIAKRLAHRNLTLGILPTGSGNGFARHFGLPVEPRASLAACNGRRVVTIDTASVNGITFLGVMGAGFDAFIADRFASSHVRGMATYVQIGVRGFFGYEPEEYELTIDGRTMRERAFVITVANASQYGNGATIAPHASTTDGLLDVVLVRDASLLGAIPLVARLFLGTIDRSSRVQTMRGQHIVIRRVAAAPAHLDGEPFSLDATLDVRVQPQSLRVLVPDAMTRC